MATPTHEELTTMTARLSAALGPDVRVACAPILETEGSEHLLPEEATAVAKAVPKRVNEFATGRRLARQLLAELGFPPQAVPANADRSPRWPPGAMGAITHTKGLCVVVVGRAGPDETVGVDVEPAEDLKADLQPLICTAKERQWLTAQPAARQGLLGRLLFSAKETLYKCQHPITGTFLGFHQAEVELMPERACFEARILHPVAARFGDHALTGHIIESERWILTAMRWPPGPGGSGPSAVGTQTAPC